MTQRILPDQDDLVAAHSKLAYEVGSLTSRLSAADAMLQSSRSEIDSLRTANARLQGIVNASANYDLAAKLVGAESEIVNLQNRVTEFSSKLAASELTVTRLQQSQSDFDGRLRADLLKLGIRANAVKLPAGDATTETKMTLTDRVKAAKAAESTQPQ